MSEWEIKHLQSRLENQEKRLDYLNETIQKLKRKTQDKYFKAVMWLMFLSYAVFWSFIVLHDHRRDISLIQAKQEQHSVKTNDVSENTEIIKKVT
jgi:hypothetical protein